LERAQNQDLAREGGVSLSIIGIGGISSWRRGAGCQRKEETVMAAISNEYKKLAFLTVDLQKWKRKYDFGSSC
jgi:hypothetical protein